MCSAMNIHLIALLVEIPRDRQHTVAGWGGILSLVLVSSQILNPSDHDQSVTTPASRKLGLFLAKWNAAFCVVASRLMFSYSANKQT